MVRVKETSNFEALKTGDEKLTKSNWRRKNRFSNCVVVVGGGGGFDFGNSFNAMRQIPQCSLSFASLIFPLFSFSQLPSVLVKNRSRQLLQSKCTNFKDFCDKNNENRIKKAENFGEQ